MRRFLAMTVIMLCGAIVLCSCDDGGGGDDSSGGSLTGAGFDENTGSGAGGNVQDNPEAGAGGDVGEDSDSAFSNIMPTGIVQTGKEVDKVNNITTLHVACDPIEGAVRYMFNAANVTRITATPQATVQVTVAQGAAGYDCCVFAYNARNETTKVACARLNE